jgi:hypothetical protein
MRPVAERIPFRQPAGAIEISLAFLYTKFVISTPVASIFSVSLGVLIGWLHVLNYKVGGAESPSEMECWNLN